MATWILLRGLTRETRHWGDFPEILQRALPGARIEAVDLPGNGALHQIASPTSVARMAEHCRETLGRRGIAPPYHLLAMSLGAMVAVAWAHAHPREVAACVLINTSLRPYSPFYRRLRPGTYLPLLRLAVLDGTPRAWERIILKLTSQRHAGDAGLLDQWAAIRQRHPVSRRNAGRQLLAAARYRAPKGAPPAPVLLLASTADQLVDGTCSRTLAQAWDCAIRWHPRAGHDLPLDDGPWVVEQVRQWATSLEPGRRL